MPDPVVVIGTVVAGVMGGIGVWWSKRASAKAGVGVSPSEAISNLQVIADTWEERFNLEHQARVTADQALVDAKAGQAIERELAAQCRSDLDDARSKIRLLERRRSPRPGA